MPVYEYQCAAGHVRSDVASRDNSDRLTGRLCRRFGEEPASCNLPVRRRYSVSFAPVMQEHFNATVGKPISSMNQFRSELSRASDAATARTGILHDYQPIDPSEAKAPE